MKVARFVLKIVAASLAFAAAVFAACYLLPLDWLLGTLATFLACLAMWGTRKYKLWGLPLLGLAMPALTNAFLVGGELTIYIGGAFWLNAVLVAAGELIVLYTAGIVLYTAIHSRGLDTRLFALK